MNKISVSIIALNEEKNIRECLRSVTWADEIVVVDGGSSDSTVAIAAEFTNQVYVQQWPGFARQKQYAMDLCRHPWILSLDADERVSPELHQEIVSVLSQSGPFAGYLVPRRSFFLKKWIRHCGWYPGYQLRLFLKNKTRVSECHVHEGFLVDGPVRKLTRDLVHFSHPTLFDSLAKLNHYTSLEAMDRLDRKKVSWRHFIFHPLSTFLLKYVRQKGFLDGLEGFLLSLIAAFSKMVLYIKIWRLQRLRPDAVRDVHRGAL